MLQNFVRVKADVSNPHQSDTGLGDDCKSKTGLTNPDDSPAVIHLTESEFPFQFA
jgi:hypothetical protein